MNPCRELYIESVARQTLESSGLSDEAPINAKSIAEILGGKVQTVVISCSRMPHGACVIKRGDSFIIKVMDDEVDRRNYLIAHQLGHLLIHMNYGLEEYKEFADGDGYDLDELKVGDDRMLDHEAHVFACELIMPRSSFARELKKRSEYGRYDLNALAKVFDVTPNTIRQRGIHLMIIDDRQ